MSFFNGTALYRIYNLFLKKNDREINVVLALYVFCVCISALLVHNHDSQKHHCHRAILTLTDCEFNL